jgi:hypothetical protein
LIELATFDTSTKHITSKDNAKGSRIAPTTIGLPKYAVSAPIGFGRIASEARASQTEN